MTNFALRKAFPVLLLMAAIFLAPHPASAAPPRPQGPCDIYAAANTPCVAAHSTTRALYAAYSGPLYQVKRQSDSKTLDIGLIRTAGNNIGGYADAAAQDAFCVNTVCVINLIYDQSGNGNHLFQAPPGTFKGPAKGAFDTQPIADTAPVSIGGHKVYGVYIIPGMGFRNNNASGIAVGDEPEGIYSVVDGTHYDSGCCFDYGNSSTNGRAVGTGTMETTYFGNSTVWGSGTGTGPWTMSDMEAGLFSGHNAKQNAADPTINSWRFVTEVVDGGGGNRWDLRGGNAQQGALQTFYSGERPGPSTGGGYFPMHKKGAILLGTGGDNGNGSSGTFYEGVMTTGYPTEATTDAVQANVVAARYNVGPLSLSRVTQFTPGASQHVTATFTNVTDKPIAGLAISLAGPLSMRIVASGHGGRTDFFDEVIAPGASTTGEFIVNAPAANVAGYLTAHAAYNDAKTGAPHAETATTRVRSVFPVKINEVCFGSSSNPSDQFIELYNGSDHAVDISNWILTSAQSQWAAVNLAKVPPATKLAAHGFYLLGLAGSGLAAPANAGAAAILVRSSNGFAAGQKIEIDGESRTVASVGSAASPLTTIFIPVSTDPRRTFTAGSTNLPVTSAAGFQVGQKIGIDPGDEYEVATVTTIGKPGTQTTLADEATAGATAVRIAAGSNLTQGDSLTLDTGARKEVVKVAGVDGAGVQLAAPLKLSHTAGVDVSDIGTGISFSPATRFTHQAGDALQALGSGITLDRPLARSHVSGAPVVNPEAAVGYQGAPAPNLWFGSMLSASAGSIALADGTAVVDAIVYGSQQSNSSGNGTIASPELATLLTGQEAGGCIVAVSAGQAGVSSGKSWGRYPDGADTGRLCSDFRAQTAAVLAGPSPAGATNIKVQSVDGFNLGQKIIIDSGASQETAVIATIGTPGFTTLNSAVAAGATSLAVANALGFRPGQTVTVGEGAEQETATVAAGARRGAPTITLSAPLRSAHAAETPVAGTGISLAAPLSRPHAAGAQIADSLPTPGAPNKYVK